MLQDIGDEDRIERCSGWLGAWVGDELVLMSAEGGQFVSLSSTAGSIWDLLATSQPLKNLCAELETQYEVSENVSLRRDVVTFVREIEQTGALRVSNGNPL